MDSRKSKILVRYDEIFSQDLPNDNLFWDEIFLLRPNTEYLCAKLKESSLPLLEQRSSSLQTLMERSAVCVSSETSVAVYNACQTFLTILEDVVSRFGLKKAVEILFDDAERCCTAILRRFYFFIVETVHSDLKSLSMHFTERFALLAAKDEDLPLLSSLVYSAAFDVLTAVFAQYDTLRRLGKQALRTLAVMLARVKTNEDPSNPLISKFSTLHDEASLQGLAQQILEQIETANESTASYIANNAEGLFSKITSIFSSKEIRDAQPNYDMAMDLPSLFIFYEAVRYNKTFVGEVLTTRSSLETSDEEKERSLLLRNFLTFCSLAFEETKNEPGLFCGRLCLLSLLRLTDDVFVQNTLHDPHTTFDCKRPPCTIGSTVLDLVSELLVSHLKIGYPLEFHELTMGILHRVLAYQKNRCIRMNHWQPIFNAMLSLLRFLLTNEKKCTVAIYSLCFRVMTVVNLFLTFGDTFLPSGEAYDLLYYELVRQETIFVQLGEAVERRLQMEKNADWEWAARVKSHLINPMIIINTIKEKMNAAGNNLEHEQIIELIRSSFETLSLKLYDGLTTVPPYDHSRQKPFFLLVARSLQKEGEKRRVNEANPFEYSSLVENLSSIQY